MAKFDPFLSLDCAPQPSTLAQSKERKGSNFAIWQPWRHGDKMGFYGVGMIMRHKRYDYECVIYGWNEYCAQSQVL